jgi:hypothetical protein
LSEENKNEKDKHKIVPFIIRVPKWLLEAYDKTCPNGRPEPIRGFMRERVATHGGTIQVNYDELLSQETKHKAEMDRLSKNEKIGKVLYLVLKDGPLRVEYISQIIMDLIEYEVKETDAFSKYDVENCIQFLEVNRELESVLQQIKNYRVAKYGIFETETKEQRNKRHYVPLALRDHNCEFYETDEDHKSRLQKEMEEQEAENREEQQEREKWLAENSDEEEDDNEEEWEEH